MMSPSNKKAEQLFQSIGMDLKNPYVFSMRKLLAPTQQRFRKAHTNERDIVREQHQTLFESDGGLQELFGGNFDEYFTAVENPQVLVGKIKDMPSAEDLAELISDDEMLAELEETDPEFAHDALYKACSQWSSHLHELGHHIYDHSKRKDLDVFRVTINSILVGAKIAYALDLDEDALEHEDAEVITAEIEISIRAFNLASTFLSRVRESLVRLTTKKFEPIHEWGKAIVEADKIAFEIQKRVLDLQRKLHPPMH